MTIPHTREMNDWERYNTGNWTLNIWSETNERPVAGQLITDYRSIMALLQERKTYIKKFLYHCFNFHKTTMIYTLNNYATPPGLAAEESWNVNPNWLCRVKSSSAKDWQLSPELTGLLKCKYPQYSTHLTLPSMNADDTDKTPSPDQKHNINHQCTTTAFGRNSKDVFCFN